MKKSIFPIIIFVFTASMVLASQGWVGAMIVGMGGSSSIPAAPTGHSVVAGASQNVLHPGTSADATSYNAYWNTTGNPTKASTKITGVTDGQAHIGLTNGLAYSYMFTAVNSAGESPASTIDTATPTTVVFTDNMANADNWSYVTGFAYSTYSHFAASGGYLISSGDGSSAAAVAQHNVSFTHAVQASMKVTANEGARLLMVTAGSESAPFTSNYELSITDAGASSTWALDPDNGSHLINGTWSNDGASHTWRIEVAGGTVTVKKDGVTLNSGSSSAHTSFGAVTLLIGNGSNKVTITNVQAES